LRFSDKALCKPLDVREKAFYEKLANNYPQLLPFVATYLGVVNVTFRPRYGGDMMVDPPVIMLEHNKHILGALDENQEGNTISNGKYFNQKLQQQIFREALSPHGIKARFAQLKLIPDVSKICLKDKDTKKISKEDADFEGCNQSDSDAIFRMSDEDSTPTIKHTKALRNSLIGELSPEEMHDLSEDQIDSSSFPTNSKGRHGAKHFNPWSAHLYNTRMAKLTERDAEQTTQQFLLLEDLTEGLIFPCILDLKMGSRQHGVHATAEKKASQERKCEKSTSKRLGVRICGMQVLYINDSYTNSTPNLLSIWTSMLEGK
jgi:hypothetical protein